VDRVLKCVFAHSTSDPYFLLFREGLVHVCETTGTTLDYVNVPEPEVDVVAYKDALRHESKGHHLVLCQHLPDMQQPLSEYLSSSVKKAIVVKPPVSSTMLSPVVFHRVGFDGDRLLKRLLELLPDRPAIVALPWFVDASTLDASVSVERFSEEALLTRARSDRIMTVVVPTQQGLDYTRVQSLFPAAKLGLVGLAPPASGVACSAYVWQDPRDQGMLAALLAVNHDAHLAGQADVTTDVKFHVR
jgi:hypothetical protein